MGYRDKMKIEIVCTRDGQERLSRLLEQLRIMGSIGASRDIKIDDWNRKESWGENDFYWDGDGASQIKSIEVTELCSMHRMRRMRDAREKGLCYIWGKGRVV